MLIEEQALESRTVSKKYLVLGLTWLVYSVSPGFSIGETM